MTSYKLYAVFSVIVSLGIAAVYCVSYGYYPIAVVNGRFITARTFNTDYAVVSAYYKNISNVYGNGSSTAPSLNAGDMQESVLTGLIENALIDDGVHKEIGRDLDRLVNEKITEATNVSGIEKAVESFYGMKFGDFRKEILVPQAERDVLTGSLFLKGAKIDEWLVAAKKTGNIIILSDRFYWDGENVAKK